MNPSFKDAAGKVWPCKITAAVRDAVLEATTVDLLTLADNQAAGLKRVMTKLPILLNLMHLLAKFNGEAITEEEFIRNVDEDAFQRMMEAFIDAVADFSHPTMRAVILAAKRHGREIEKARERHGK